MKRLRNITLVAVGSILLLGNSFIASNNCRETKETFVYICQGPKSTKYHKTDRCKGLNRCSTSIKKVTLKDAEKKHNRKPCKICY